MQITRPTLVINRRRAIENIKTMAAKAKLSNVLFRPHFKTHQSPDLGRLFKALGVDSITVSSVSMAAVFAQNGWMDITIAFPVNILEIKEIEKLARQIDLNLLVLSADVVEYLEKNLNLDGRTASKASSPDRGVTKNPSETSLTVGVWIKIDTGYGRTGIPYTGKNEAVALAQKITECSKLKFKGLLTHAGHSYDTKKDAERIALFAETKERLSEVRQAILSSPIISSTSLSEDIECALSVGDTPCCSSVDNFSGVDEVRPGNFFLYDVQQLCIGSCKESEIAAAVVAPVVAVHPERGEVILYCGAVHLSKQSLLTPEGTQIFGYVVPWEGRGWGAIDKKAYVRAVSQEHGMAVLPPHMLKAIKPGSRLAVLPVHSCLTVDLMLHKDTVVL